MDELDFRVEALATLSKKTYHFGWRQEVVYPGDAPHALQVLLRLDGNSAEGSAHLTSRHRHLDARLGHGRDLGALQPGRGPAPLHQGQRRAGGRLAFGELLRADAGGRPSESNWLRQEGGGGSGGGGGRCRHVGAEGEDGSVQRPQGLLPQLVERRGAHLATAATSLVARWCLELLEEEGCISWILQGEETRQEALSPTAQSFA